MKQKYVLTKGEKQDTLTISEYTELENDILSLVCEESHDGPVIRAAIETGIGTLISTFRTHNMYPKMSYAEKIAQGIMELYETDEETSVELIFDDRDAFQRSGEETAAVLDLIKKESATISSLIDGDDDDEDNDDDGGDEDSAEESDVESDYDDDDMESDNQDDGPSDDLDADD
jgi:hypothetical protein